MNSQTRKCKCTHSIWFAVCYCMFLQLPFISSTDSAVKFIIYKNCTVSSLLDDRCRIQMTFSDFMKINMFSTNNVQSDLADGSYSTGWYNNSKLAYTQIITDSLQCTEIMVRQCTCHAKSVNSETENSNFHTTLKDNLSRVYKPNETFCSHVLRDLFRIRPSLCYIRHYYMRDDIQCQFPVKLTAQRYLRIWSRLQTCKEYLTSKRQTPFCTCTLHLQIHNCSHKTHPPTLKRQPHLSSLGVLQEKDRQQMQLGNYLLLSKAVKELTLTDKVICPNGVHHGNCTRLHKHRSQRSLKCPPGYFGDSCSSVCHCKNKESCDPISGVCKSVTCALGWEGANCSHRKCPIGYYGMTYDNGCQKKCDCHKPGDCNVINGECYIEMCLNNTYTLDCAEQMCPRHFYVSFSKSCNNKCWCAHDLVCHSITGFCPGSQCKTGYQPPTCVYPQDTMFPTRRICQALILVFLLLVKLWGAINLRILPLLTDSLMH